MQTQLTEMNKAELRAACKNACVKNYGKMTVDGMRAALGALATAAPETAASVETSTTTAGKSVVYKTPKVQREIQNGVRKPIKGVCADVWAKCAELHETDQLGSQTLLAWSDEKGLNRNNTSIELSAFRRFHGIARKEMKASP